MAKITKDIFITEISQNAKMSKHDVELVLQAIETVIINNMKQNNEIMLSGICSIKKQHMKEKIGQNMHDNTPFVIPTYDKIKITLGKDVLNKINT